MLPFVSWSGNTLTESFVADASEHYADVGHPGFGRLDKLDRKGASLNVLG